jgi:hypothetical protein
VENLNTYELIGIPDALAVVFVLVCLSLALAPWFGGKELGPVKVPRLAERTNRRLRIVAPLCVFLFILGFAKVWLTTPRDPSSISHTETPNAVTGNKGTSVVATDKAKVTVKQTISRGNNSGPFRNHSSHVGKSPKGGARSGDKGISVNASGSSEVNIRQEQR